MKEGKMTKSKIWLELYGTQSNDFIEGVIAGVEMYAIWRNGKRYVGVREEPLEDVIADIKDQLGWNLTVER
uniref:Uncharacterized protein n=1 Tax=viral metagenome TaxID=1070528 RepID=A0A6M3IMT2_9ZZZZ